MTYDICQLPWWKYQLMRLLLVEISIYGEF